ncbi:hypothetical protein C8A03DRAFT_19708 [Achaetomium macrosporum]|uniref:Protein NO VEIN C-terminal domain-containing protein n=1 Tax=Achaetomium macrosporum TaxID=79813 RepID=A0AAN7C0U1_9PEZI|nr:hypothetical protein C8A03DRAFT_19708 [Achaetomium macrosporum]
MYGTTRPSSQAEARRLVESIANDHGYIHQEVFDRMSDADRRVVQRAIRVKDRLIASSVVTLAQNLYTSNERFVFELLQNAEDNDYAKARAHGEAPKVSFSVYPNHVVVECNEDGFTDGNLRAICNVGKSSKREAQGYIGEKGIGFKSVFMVAHRVHVQSGHFSFRFLHRQGDSGIGMITPIWDEDGEYLGDRCTRITLDLQQSRTTEEQARRRQTIEQQFRDIHDTILLFMKKIREIKIAFYDQEMGEADQPISTITHSIDRWGTRAVCKKHTSQKSGGRRAEVRHYHITEHIATGLPKAEGRIYSESEERSRAYSQGEVVLAFPLTENSVPVLENQWVFAFLPVRQMGFKFLVQADFVTQANRQDIVTTSARNEALATGIADAFIKGVLQLCDHATLQYQWMRYLPEEKAYPWDGFWKDVIVKIKDRIMSTPVLRPASPGPLKLIRNSRKHSPSYLDAFGEPLLPDTPPERYLSLEYQSADLDRLEDFGLDTMYVTEFILRAESDLARSTSRMRTNRDEDWQSRVAKALHIPFTWPVQLLCREVTELSLLPLREGRWTSTTSGPVYYAKAEGTNLAIPPGILLRVIDPTAAGNPLRKQLFDAVGVQDAPVSIVRAAVLETYRNRIVSPILSWSVSYLRFLFLTESFVDAAYNDYQDLRIYSSCGQLEDTRKVDLYIRNDHPYGAVQLLAPTEPGRDPGSGAPGFEVLYAHEAYFQDPPSRPDTNWGKWLEVSFRLQSWLPLARKAGDGTGELEITPICRYVAQHRPEKFLGLLRANWELDGLQYEGRESAIIWDLGQVLVLCEGPGINLRPLNSTYLPIGELVALCDRFMLDREFFPWLKLEDPLSNDTAPTEWRHLASAFGLGYDRRLLDFTLVALKFILDANPNPMTLEQPERMYKLYGYLQVKVDESDDGPACREQIRSIFASQRSIFVPRCDVLDAAWVKPTECLWSAPLTMRSKFTIASVCSDTFSIGHINLHLLEAFFVSTLGVAPNCTWEDIVTEIKEWKTRRDINLDRARELYQCLADMRLIGISASDLRRTFEAEPLICGFDDNEVASWYTASDCLWSSTTTIRGKLILDDLYEDLEGFFVGTLGISELTAEMVYSKLTSQHDPELSVEEAKETLVAFNSFLAIDDGGLGFDEFQPTPVLKNRVFPVRFPSGEVELLTGTEGFALLDRRPLGEDFAGLAKFLDFGMDELRMLRPLIRWAGLGNRYLSKSVKEISRADSESTRPISALHRDIRGKAHALLRIAMTYNSPRIQGDRNAFYALLQNSETLETERITAELLLSQDNDVLRVEKESASLHIREEAHGLTFYVPRDNRSQEVCFNSKLPRRLCEWIMTNPATQITEPTSSEAVTAVQSVLNAKSFALDDILDEHGIVAVGVADTEMEILAAEEDASVGSRTATPATSAEVDGDGVLPWPGTPPSRHRQAAQAESSENDSYSSGLVTPSASVPTPEVDNSTSYIVARSRQAALRPQTIRPISAYGVEDAQYASLLRSVVSAARRATFPSRGAFDVSGLQGALPGSTGDHDCVPEAYRLRSDSQIERDKRIGAAGELFVSVANHDGILKRAS